MSVSWSWEVRATSGTLPLPSAASWGAGWRLRDTGTARPECGQPHPRAGRARTAAITAILELLDDRVVLREGRARCRPRKNRRRSPRAWSSTSHPCRRPSGSTPCTSSSTASTAASRSSTARRTSSRAGPATTSRSSPNLTEPLAEALRDNALHVGQDLFGARMRAMAALRLVSARMADLREPGTNPAFTQRWALAFDEAGRPDPRLRPRPAGRAPGPPLRPLQLRPGRRVSATR